MKKFALSILGVVMLLVVLIAIDLEDRHRPADNPSPNHATSSTAYETDYLTVTLPADWTASEATTSVSVGTCTEDKSDCTETTRTEVNPAAVNIRKGKYLLSINVRASQASGVEGGRFAEIAMGQPSADAVVTEQPSSPCSDPKRSPVSFDLQRNDLYVDSAAHPDYCAAPTTGSVWYFSFLSTGHNGYFNYYPALEGQSQGAFVVTMAYDSRNVNELPAKDSPELAEALTEMTNIAKTLVIKEKSLTAVNP